MFAWCGMPLYLRLQGWICVYERINAQVMSTNDCKLPTMYVLKVVCYPAHDSHAVCREFDGLLLDVQLLVLHHVTLPACRSHLPLDLCHKSTYSQHEFARKMTAEME